MALNNLSTFPVSCQGEKKSPLSYSAGMGMRLQHPGLPQLQQGFTGHHSPQPNDPEPFRKTQGRAGGASPLHRAAPFTLATMNLNLFPSELSTIFLFTDTGLQSPVVQTGLENTQLSQMKLRFNSQGFRSKSFPLNSHFFACLDSCHSALPMQHTLLQTRLIRRDLFLQWGDKISLLRA